MNWFKGSIPEAIQAAKSVKGIFVVFVYDETDSSKSSIEVLDHEPVSKLLGTDDIVAIKLEHGSISAKQFGAIYPLLLVPALFFIDGDNGVLKELIAGPFQEAVLVDKIGKLKLVAVKPSSSHTESVNVEPTSCSTPQEAQSVEEPKAESSHTEEQESEQSATPAAVLPESVGETSQSSGALPYAAAEAAQTSGSPPATAAEAAQTSGSPPATDVAAAQSSNEASAPLLDDKLERARLLTAELQRTKQLEQDEDEKRKEMERRKIGQQMAQAQKDRDDLQRGNYARQRKREKEEEKVARQRVKAQIAADRAERDARQALFRGDSPPSSQSPPQPSADIQAQACAAGRDSSSTRIKFRLPDGSSMQERFPSETKLSSLRDLCQDSVSGPAILSSSLHPEQYSVSEMDRSLAQLDLVPSAIIVVKTKSSINSPPGSTVNSVVSTTTSSIYSLGLMFLAPFTTLYNYVMQFLGFQQHDDDKKEEGKHGTDKRTPKDTKKFRRDGNIHRLGNLSDDEDDDDDNNTWNGNSTQQM